MAITIEFQPLGLRLVSEKPVNALDAARQAGITLSAVCGGEGTCGKCVVQILSKKDQFPASVAEKKLLSEKEIADGYRLACMTMIGQDIKINIPSTSVIENQILQTEGTQQKVHVNPAISQDQVTIPQATLNDLVSDFSRVKASLAQNDLSASIEVLRKIPPILRNNEWGINLVFRGKELIHVSTAKIPAPLGLAVDVGSTKIACYLIDIENGTLLTAMGTPNPQIAYGEDIMARIAYAIQDPGYSQTLNKLTINAINETSAAMCSKIGKEIGDIADICLVGNTAMHHFYLGLPTDSLAVSPFVPALTDALYLPAGSLGLIAMPGAGVYVPPVKAGFIGSDHLSFLYAAHFDKDQRVRLGIDIGTNTEIALQANGHIVSVSTASGPAFEGAHINFGMRAAPGAIEHVWINENWQTKVEVIGSQPAVGICGSGILDAIAQMRLRGVINERGRLNKEGRNIKPDRDGKPAFHLTNEKSPITLSQSDINQILLAKGAIRAGIDILMDRLHVNPGEIEEVVIAGAFGSYMMPEHAISIGMLPKIALEKIKVIGNAAGTGARMMLININARKEAERLAEMIEYLELTVYPDFSLFYANGIRA